MYRHIPVWHFWDPRSGPEGGMIFVVVVWAIIVIIKLTLRYTYC